MKALNGKIRMMRTVILPGFSPKNREWAEMTKQQLENQGSAVDVYYWKHWDEGSPEEDWIKKESRRIREKYTGEKVNLIAKSIGTAVAMDIFGSAPELTEKIILCGIPIRDFSPGTEDYYLPLEQTGRAKILIIQNENDNHGSLAVVREFVNKINRGLKIIPKPRSDHEYPYQKDFIEFLNERNMITPTRCEG